MSLNKKKTEESNKENKQFWKKEIIDINFLLMFESNYRMPLGNSAYKVFIVIFHKVKAFLFSLK